MRVSFIVPGVPVGKGRPRFARQSTFVRTYTPRKTAEYEDSVIRAYIHQCGEVSFGDSPIGMRIIARFPIPKSTKKSFIEAMLCGELFPAKKPDLDNIVKCVEDALNGVAYDDDKQIVCLEARKVYGENPCVWVELFK